MESDGGIDLGDNIADMLHRTHNYEDKSKLPNEEAKRFYRLVEDGKQPLYQGCKNFTRLSFLIRLYSLKYVHGMTESAFGSLLELIKEAFPQAHIPLSFNAAKNVIRYLGLDYKKIHACPNNCMLFWGGDEKEDICKTCGASRWVVVEKNGTCDSDPEKLIHKVPAKIMRTFH